MNFSSYDGSSQVCSNTEVMKEKKGKKRMTNTTNTNRLYLKLDVVYGGYIVYRREYSNLREVVVYNCNTLNLTESIKRAKEFRDKEYPFSKLDCGNELV